MPEFYTNDRRNLHFDAPQFNRANHRYRGWRESEKINQEINQIRFSIYKLYERYDNINDELDVKIDLLSDGGAVTAVLNTTLDGNTSLAAKINVLHQRVKALEENRN